MDRIDFPAGTGVFIGAPAVPLDSALIAKLSNLVNSISGIEEAHLPMMYIAGKIDPPRQVLIITFASDAQENAVVAALNEGLESILTSGSSLDVIPLKRTSRLMATIRSSNCLILDRNRQPLNVGTSA
ncbi:MAG TPA: hypothetical protein VKX17_10840 [Planctomycetota bacterium]|nr:hypothetical protein [Planctomycetota bacterium]